MLASRWSSSRRCTIPPRLAASSICRSRATTRRTMAGKGVPSAPSLQQSPSASAPPASYTGARTADRERQEHGMRTGAEYRQALRDGRRVWVMGEGFIEDVTSHPATQAMVDEYVAWYDMHLDPEWTDVLFSPHDVAGARRPWAYHVPRTSDDLQRMGRSFAKTTFLSAGNITHTPAYGNLIALGVITAAQEYKAPAEQIASALAYRD